MIEKSGVLPFHNCLYLIREDLRTVGVQAIISTFNLRYSHFSEANSLDTFLELDIVLV